MRNRAKCKLCGDIIESFHSTDLILCKCGEISVDGGDSMRCAARDWKNFLRVDDEGNEVIVKIENYNEINSESNLNNNEKKISKKDLIYALEEMTKIYQSLNENAKLMPVTNYEMESVLSLLLSIFRSLQMD